MATLSMIGFRNSWPFGLCAVLLALGACATPPPPRPGGAPQAAPRSYVECEGETCDGHWERAERWIRRHAKTRRQIATPAVIRTEHPTQADPGYLFWVRKEPSESGRARITMELLCGDPRGCVPTVPEVHGAFVHYVLTGEDLLAGRRGLRSIR